MMSEKFHYDRPLGPSYDLRDPFVFDVELLNYLLNDINPDIILKYLKEQ